MNKITLGVILSLAVGIFAWAFEQVPVEELEIGAEAPLTDLEVKDVSGKALTLSGVAGENGLLVIFTCNTCPWVDRWEDRYNPVARLTKEKGIGMITLNPNTTNRDNGDGFEDMIKRAEDRNYEFYYALDENNRLADAFGATRTPHVYLFNSEMKLVYRGAIDDNAKSAQQVEKPYLTDAILEMTAGKEITTRTSKSLGCTIKRNT